MIHFIRLRGLIRKLRKPFGVLGDILRIRIKEYKKREKPINSDYDLGNNVLLYYWRLDLDNKENNITNENLGDYLSKVVITHLVPNKTHYNTLSQPITLYGIGSILGFRCQNAVVWGSGILNPNKKYLYRICLSELDIRAVRGPNTRKLLLSMGKKCPKIYGDPAILMPYIFKPKNCKKEYNVSLILHYSNDTSFEFYGREKINCINIMTTNYEFFITEIIKSKRIISSSLHGIILAEAYRVPAVLLLKEGHSLFKFEDYYISTGRNDIIVTHSIEEALKICPMPLPDFHEMQDKLLNSFPYDLWE